MKVGINENWFKALDIGGSDGDYETPYPNWSELSSKGFMSTDSSRGDNSMGGFAQEGLGVKTAMQAYTRVTQISAADILTSDLTGGIQTNWLNEIGVTQELRDGAATSVEGIFALVRYESTTDPLQIIGKMVEVGLNIAVNFLCAIPIVGWIAAAAIAIGKAFYRLKKKIDAANRDEPVIGPWQEQDARTDEYIVNTVVRDMVRSPDWTPMFLPRIKGHKDWSVVKSSEGAGTRIYGVFSDGKPDYYLPFDGLGVIPNTQMISDFMQFVAPGAQDDSEPMKMMTNRNDSIVNTGDFYPSVSQIGTTLWSWANRAGSPDMYKIDTYELEEAWRPYWESFFNSGWDLQEYYEDKKGTRNNNYLSGMAIGKSLAKFYVQGCAPWFQKPGEPTNCQIGIAPQVLRVNGNISSASLSNPSVFTDNNDMLRTWTEGLHRNAWSSPFDAIIKPALQVLRDRQWAYLAKSTVCSLVRYDQGQGPGPAFAAFAPKSGASAHRNAEREALAQRCHDMRELLVKNMARYSVRDADVRPVDPTFANVLKASKDKNPNFPITGLPPLDVQPMTKQAYAAPDALPPQGGVPFQGALNLGDLGGGKKASSGGGAAIAAAAALGLLMMSKK